MLYYIMIKKDQLIGQRGNMGPQPGQVGLFMTQVYNRIQKIAREILKIMNKKRPIYRTTGQDTPQSR